MGEEFSMRQKTSSITLLGKYVTSICFGKRLSLLLPTSLE
jgi:hypothetical protein